VHDNKLTDNGEGKPTSLNEKLEDVFENKDLGHVIMD
jgi:hypothetical protein